MFLIWSLRGFVKGMAAAAADNEHEGTWRPSLAGSFWAFWNKIRGSTSLPLSVGFVRSLPVPVLVFLPQGVDDRCGKALLGE